ncbi:hypothetical protein ACLOJK_018785 [Asimina triloba]
MAAFISSRSFQAASCAAAADYVNGRGVLGKMEHHNYGAPMVHEQDDVHAFNFTHRLSTEPEGF